MAENVNREDLIKGEDMEKALQTAAEIKMNILTTYKEQDKSNVDQFYETVLHTRQDITDLMDKKKKDRTDVEEKTLKDFRKNTARSYKMTADFLVHEETEDGKPTKVQKLVEKIALIFDYLKYVGNHDIENEFKKYGITISSADLETRHECWQNDRVKKNMSDILTGGRKIREKIKDDTQHITENIFQLNVPQELVYEKDSNPVGLKKSDWTKLVDLKTKLLMAKVDEQKEKVEDQANELAAEKQFDQERARLMQAKLVSMEAEPIPDEQ